MIRLCLLFLALLTGCAEQTLEPALPEPVTTDLQIADNLLLPRLNVTVQAFSSATPVDASAYDAKAQVRSVEHRLLPYQLKLTLERSGYWGAVRVMPLPDPSAELLVRGEIAFSDGTRLGLHIQVTDSTGRTWIDRLYEDTAVSSDYIDEPTLSVDPFQDLYNRIANDMAEVLLQQSLDEIDEILTVAILRYAAMLSPESFSRYLAEDDGLFRLAALPAEDDPLLQRVLRIRESEALFADSMDDHYHSLYRQIGQTYAWWRHYSFELIDGNRRLERIDPSRGATRGSWYAIERVYKTYRESRMNEDALRELTVSFDRETAPTLAEVRGRVVRLNGTLTQQYEEWRRLLGALYREETGS